MRACRRGTADRSWSLPGPGRSTRTGRRRRQWPAGPADRRPSARYRPGARTCNGESRRQVALIGGVLLRHTPGRRLRRHRQFLAWRKPVAFPVSGKSRRPVVPAPMGDRFGSAGHRLVAAPAGLSFLPVWPGTRNAGQHAATAARTAGSPCLRGSGHRPGPCRFSPGGLCSLIPKTRAWQSHPPAAPTLTRTGS